MGFNIQFSRLAPGWLVFAKSLLGLAGQSGDREINQ